MDTPNDLISAVRDRLESKGLAPATVRAALDALRPEPDTKDSAQQVEGLPFNGRPMEEAINADLRFRIDSLPSVRAARQAVIEYFGRKFRVSRIPELISRTNILLNPFTPFGTPTRFVQQFFEDCPGALETKSWFPYRDPAQRRVDRLPMPKGDLGATLKDAIGATMELGYDKATAAAAVLTGWIPREPVVKLSYEDTGLRPFRRITLSFPEFLTLGEVFQAIQNRKTRTNTRERLFNVDKVAELLAVNRIDHPMAVARARAGFVAFPNWGSLPKVKIARAKALDRLDQYARKERRWDIEVKSWRGNLSPADKVLILDAHLKVLTSFTYERVTKLNVGNLADRLDWAQKVGFDPTTVESLALMASRAESELSPNAKRNFRIASLVAEAVLEAIVNDAKEYFATEYEKRPNLSYPYRFDYFLSASDCDCRSHYIKYILARRAPSCELRILIPLAVALAKKAPSDLCFHFTGFIDNKRHYGCSIFDWGTRELAEQGDYLECYDGLWVEDLEW